MRTLRFGLAALLLASSASAQDREPPASPERAPSRGDLFPGARRVTAGAATGLPFLGIAEAGVGITNGIALSVVGGVTPSVLTAGLRPRFRVATSERTALVLVATTLFYPKASAPGPGNVGATSWLLSRPELFFDGRIADRWHLAGGMGVVAAASTEALGEVVQGRELRMPAYDGNPHAARGFAGGIWNTVASRASYELGPDTHLFGELSFVMKGVVPANDVGGPPVVFNVGAQHAF